MISASQHKTQTKPSLHYSRVSSTYAPTPQQQQLLTVRFDGLLLSKYAAKGFDDGACFSIFLGGSSSKASSKNNNVSETRGGASDFTFQLTENEGNTVLNTFARALQCDTQHKCARPPPHPTLTLTIPIYTTRTA